MRSWNTVLLLPNQEFCLQALDECTDHASEYNPEYSNRRQCCRCMKYTQLQRLISFLRSLSQEWNEF
jgi:hypothetical protein